MGRRQETEQSLRGNLQFRNLGGGEEKHFAGQKFPEVAIKRQVLANLDKKRLVAAEMVPA